jgi:hypothetical protein
MVATVDQVVAPTLRRWSFTERPDNGLPDSRSYVLDDLILRVDVKVTDVPLETPVEDAASVVTVSRSRQVEILVVLLGTS